MPGCGYDPLCDHCVEEIANERLALTTCSAWPETPGFYWWRGAPSFRWEMMQVLAYGAEDDPIRYMVQKVEARQVMRSLHVWKERGPACGEWVKISLPNATAQAPKPAPQKS